MRAIHAKLRNIQYQFRNCTNTLAVFMVLFLALVAAILYLNDRYPQNPSPFPVSTITQEPTASPVSTITPEPTTSPVPTIPPASTTPVPTITLEPVVSLIPTTLPEQVLSPVPLITIKPSPIPNTIPVPIVTPAEKATQKTAGNNVLIVIDPGHGGTDPGTCSIYKKELYEKDINLDIALRVKALLENAKVPILMTRESDKEVYQSTKYDPDQDLQERSGIANRNKATLFVSIHVNAYDTKLPGGEHHNGTEIYHAGKTHGVFTSKKFAEMMGKAIEQKTQAKYNGVVKKNFSVLRLSNMPALLIETAYLTNKEEHKRLESDEFRNAMAVGIYDGIIEILKTMGLHKKNNTWCITAEDSS